jgi:type VI secretion system protein ImpA
MLDVQALAEPALTEPPGGPDLQYSPEYASLERSVAGKPETQVGDKIVPAEPPDWRAAAAGAQPLLVRSKDLRVAMVLTRALLETTGFEGLASGLALLGRLVVGFWPVLHPKLDAEDNDDPTARVNAMAGLVSRDLIQAVRAAAVVTSPALGPISLKSIEAAGPKGAASVDAALEHVPAEALERAAGTLTLCVQEATALATAWAKALPSSGPDFTELLRTVAQAQRVVASRMNRPAEGSGVAGASASADGAPAAPPRALHGEVRSREDVVRAIDAICAYYLRAEPSSPVPLLLQRSRRLVTMSFVDILKEMLPEAVAPLQKISGKTDG